LQDFWPKDDMRYAIADIHGGIRTFAALLDKIALQHSDQLYLLGDYVDEDLTGGTQCMRISTLGKKCWVNCHADVDQIRMPIHTCQG